MTQDNEQYVSAHSAAAALVRKRVEQGVMTRDEAIAFSDLIYNLVSTGQLPDDPKLLGLTEGQWKIATSEAHTTADIVSLKLP